MANLISAFGEFFSMFGLLGIPLLLGAIAVFIGIPAFIIISVFKMIQGEPKEKTKKGELPNNFFALSDLRDKAKRNGDDVMLLRTTEAIQKLHNRDKFYPYDLYKYYRDGIGTKPNPKKALEYLRLAAELGNNEARTEYASQLISDGHCDDGIALYRACTYDHHKDAPFMMYRLYESKIIPIGDLSAAEYRDEMRRWLFYAATLGHEEAQSIYQEFIGDPFIIKQRTAEYALALKDGGITEASTPHLMTAAVLGDKTAQHLMGYILKLEEDYHEAELFLLASALQGYSSAALDLGRLLVEHIGRFNEGIQWLEKAAKLGSTEAYQHLGIAWFNRGCDCEHDQDHQTFVNSVKWFREGAEKGDAACINKLGHLYNIGYGGLPRDPDIAREWIKKAAALGHQPAIDWIATHI